MRALAAIWSAEKRHTSRGNHPKWVPASIKSANPGSNQIWLQRKASCACGGGCPRCANEIKPQGIQTKLKVSTPGDQYEQEADRVAEQVLRMTALSSTARVTASGGVSNPPPQRKCSACAEPQPCASHEDEEDLQAKSRRRRPHVAPKTQSQIDTLLVGGGQQLDPATRAFMEPRFGHAPYPVGGLGSSIYLSSAGGDRGDKMEQGADSTTTVERGQLSASLQSSTEDSGVARLIQRQVKRTEAGDLIGEPISLSTKVVNPGQSTWSLVTDSVAQNAGRLASAIRPNTDFSDYGGWQLEQKEKISEYVRDDAAGVDIELKATWEHSGVPIKGGTGRYIGPTGIVVEVSRLDAPTIVNIKVDSARAGFDSWSNVAELSFDLSATIKSAAASKNYHGSITFSGDGNWRQDPVTKPAQEKPMSESPDASPIPILQAGNSTEEVQRKCGEPSDGEPLSRFQSPSPATSAVEEVLQAENGKPLDNPIRTFMESRFGHDFGGVRIHTDDSAVRSAEAIKAHAYTVGRDIVFGASQFAPETLAGRHLLAHELTHVMQQARLDPAPQRFIQRQAGSVKEMAEAVKKEWDKKKKEVEAAEKAAIPVGATSLPPNVEREVKWHLKNSNRQEALNALVDHLVSAGKIKRDYLYEKKMFYDAALQAKEGQAEAKGKGPNSILVKISIGIAAYDPPIKGDPTKRAGPNISWLYSSVLHEYQHALQIQGPDGDLSKIADDDERWTKRYIRDIEAYAVEIKEASNTGLDKKPELMEDIWRRLHEDNWLKLNNKLMLAKAKVQALLTKAEKERLNKLYGDAYNTAKTVVGKLLGYAPFKLP